MVNWNPTVFNIIYYFDKILNYIDFQSMNAEHEIEVRSY